MTSPSDARADADRFAAGTHRFTYGAARRSQEKIQVADGIQPGNIRQTDGQRAGSRDVKGLHERLLALDETGGVIEHGVRGSRTER